MKDFRYPIRCGLQHVVTLPEGWGVAFLEDNVVAIHLFHAPKIMSLSRAGEVPFEEWPDA